MAVWSDSKLSETAHALSRPCSLWDCEEIHDSGCSSAMACGYCVGLRMLSVTAESGHQIYEYRDTRVHTSLFTSLFTHNNRQRTL
jgi:hypothetical protein